MTIKAVFWALEQHDLKPIEQIVLIRLCDHANEKSYDEQEGTYYCFPRQQTLADRCNVNRRTILRVIERLQEMGYLTIETRFNDDGRQVSNVYKLNVSVKAEQVKKPDNSGCDKLSHQDDEPEIEENPVRQNVTAGVTKCHTGGVENVTPGVHQMSHRGCRECHTYNQEVNQEVNQRETPLEPLDKNSKDPREKFQMFLEWEPEQKSFSAYAAGCGIDPRSITDSEKLEFKRYWIGEHVEKTQHQWENKLVQTLQFNRSKNQPGQPEPVFKPVENLSDEEVQERAYRQDMATEARALAQEVDHLKVLIERTPEHGRQSLRGQLKEKTEDLKELGIRIHEIDQRNAHQGAA